MILCSHLLTMYLYRIYYESNIFSLRFLCQTMSTDFMLSSRNTVEIEDFPYKWTPFLSFFNSDVPAFPLHRVHVKRGRERIFGVPVTWRSKEKDSTGSCTLELDVISNKSLNEVSSDAEDAFQRELRERLGFSEALSKQDLLNCCKNTDMTVDERHQKWRTIVNIIFPRLEAYYGDRLKCGRFYSRTYGLFRLVSTWNVQGGEKQEVIMTSNLLNTVGQHVESEHGEAINLHLVPTYGEILDDDLAEFPKFESLKIAVEDFGDQYLTKEYTAQESTVYLLDDDVYVPRTAETWHETMSTVESDNQEILVQLKEDLNRNWQRPFVLIQYLYNVFQGVNFNHFTVDDYIAIRDKGTRNMYPKVLAMVLQQAFGNYDCIPVDRWVTEFFETLLDTPESAIPKSGTEMGKFERFVWETAQIRKTNQPLFKDIVHCIKTGVMYSKGKKMRNPNPLSCYLCELSEEECPSYLEISDQHVAVIERDRFKQEGGRSSIEFDTPARKISDDHGELYLDDSEFSFGELQRIEFIIITISGKALASYSPTRKDKRRWKRTDDMSAFTTHIPLDEGIHKIEEIVQSPVRG